MKPLGLRLRVKDGKDDDHFALFRPLRREDFFFLEDRPVSMDDVLLGNRLTVPRIVARLAEVWPYVWLWGVNPPMPGERCCACRKVAVKYLYTLFSPLVKGGMELCRTCFLATAREGALWRDDL